VKILLLTDNEDNWSGHNRCKTIQRLLPQYHFDIYQGWSKKNWVSRVCGRYDIVHLNYMAIIHEHFSTVKTHPQRFMMTIANERSLLFGHAIQKEEVEGMMSSCAYVTSVTKKIADLYNVEYLPNGVDLNMFKEPKKVVVGYVGTEGENKNYPLLAKVCSDLGVKLLAMLYKKNQVPQEELYKYYQQMDLFIHPSKTEGCSNVILEALSMNVPVFMTKEGVWHDLKDWVTFIEPTYEGIANVIKKYKAREFIKERFNWEQIVKRYGEIYEQIVSRKDHVSPMP